MVFFPASDDLDMILAVGGEAVTLDSGTATSEVSALYERAYVEIQGVEGYRPSLTCRTADVSSVARGWTVTLQTTGGDFTVVGKQVMGDGITVLVLEPAAGPASDEEGGDGYGGGKWPAPEA